MADRVKLPSRQRPYWLGPAPSSYLEVLVHLSPPGVSRFGWAIAGIGLVMVILSQLRPSGPAFGQLAQAVPHMPSFGGVGGSLQCLAHQRSGCREVTEFGV